VSIAALRVESGMKTNAELLHILSRKVEVLDQVKPMTPVTWWRLPAYLPEEFLPKTFAIGSYRC